MTCDEVQPFETRTIILYKKLRRTFQSIIYELAGALLAILVVGVAGLVVGVVVVVVVVVVLVVVVVVVVVVV